MKGQQKRKQHEMKSRIVVEDKEPIHSSEGETSESESDSEPETASVPVRSVRDKTQSVFKNKEKVLVLASRGITHRYRNTASLQ